MKLKSLFLLIAMSLSTSVFAAPVNINSADSKAIASALNGIGQSKAEAIVQYRTENGHFKTVEDIKKVKGIGSKTFEKIKADLILSVK